MTNIILCAMAKCENQYINEWIDWHLKLGFDKIIIYDNNDISGERISDVVVPSLKLEIVDWRGKTQASCGAQVAAYNDCYRKHTNYDWVMFLDIDEFLEFKGGISVKDYLSNDWISKADIIKFHWKCYSDNGYLHKPEGLVTDNYKELCDDQLVNKFTKSIYRGGLNKFNMVNVHYCDDNMYKVYYQNGAPANKLKCVTDNNINHDNGWVRHYVTKSVEEFITIKYARRGPGKSRTRLSETLYFKYNKRTSEKEKLLRELYSKFNRQESTSTKSNTKLKDFLTKPKPLKKSEPNPERVIKKPQAVIKTQKVVTKKVDHEIKKAVPNRFDITKSPAVNKSSELIKPITIRGLRGNPKLDYSLGISVCVSAWKTAGYIEECLDTIANQTWFRTHDNWEILLGIDACEETLAKVKEIMHKYKNLKVMMMDKNVGTYVTCNTIMKEASYEWLLRFDSDDVMYPNMVEVLMNKKRTAEFVLCKCNNRKNGNKTFLAEGQIFVSKDCFIRYGGFLNRRCGSDTEFHKRTENKIKQLQIQDALFLRRERDDSLTKINDYGHKSKYRDEVKQYIKEKSIHISKIELVTENYTSIFDNRKYLDDNFCGKQYNGEKAIISLTSFRARINTVHITLESLLKYCIGYHVVLVLSSDEFLKKNNELPKTLLDLVNNKKIELLWVKQNYKAFKKVIFTSQKYKGVPIISADDDCSYICNYAQELYDKWLSTPNDVIRYNMYNIRDDWQFTQGPSTLYPPFCYNLVFKDIINNLSLNKISDLMNDDNLITRIIKNKKIHISHVYRGHKFCFKFHNEISAIHNNKVNEDFKSCYE